MRRALFIFAITFLLVLLVYRRAPMNFFRAESGWYLSNSHADAETQRKFKADFFSRSYAGHYTPFAFLAEFGTAKAFGTNGTLWRLRQLVAVAAIGALLFAATYSIGAAVGLARIQNGAIAAAVTAVSIYQPLMIDFVGWPFMILQLAWIALLLLTLWALTKAALGNRKRRFAWIAAMSAYASMHFSGLGVVTVAATTVCLATVSLSLPRGAAESRDIRLALITMLCLAGIHGALMIYLLPPELVAAGASRPLGASVKLALGFVANFTFAGIGSFVATASGPPNARSIAYSWPYGALLLAGAVAAPVWLFRRWSADTSPQNLLRFVLVAFSAVSFVMLMVLFWARYFRFGITMEALASQVAFCTSVPRYVIPLHFIFVPIVILVATQVARFAPRPTFGLCVGVVVAAIAAQMEFQKSTHRYVAPLGQLSHSSAWRLILQTVQECRAAGLPVPNVPLGTLTQEFHDIDPRMFEPLLRRDLRLAFDEKIPLIPWEEYLAAPDRYRAVPSLSLLEAKLRIKRE